MDWDEACRQASGLVASRNYAEAEQVIHGAYNQVKATNNLEKICTSLDLLGWLSFMQAKYQQSSEIYYYCAQAKVQLLGKDNIEVAKTIKNIIASTYQVKQYDKVVDMARECLRIYALHLPREHPEISTLAKNLYELLKWMNRMPEAEQVRQLYLEPPGQPQAQTQSGVYQAPQQSQPQQQVQPQPQPQVQPQQEVQAQPQQYAQSQSGAYQAPQQAQPQQYAQSQSGAYQVPQQAQPQTQAQSSTASGQWSQQGFSGQTQAQPQQQQQPQQPAPAASQGHFRQISVPAPAPAPQTQAPLSASQAPVQGAAPAEPASDSAAKAAAARRKDYAKFAKNICEVCKQEYEGVGCQRCTSAGIKVFDPGSTFGSEW